MPKMFVHATHGMFDADARVRVAAELTELGMRCEALADTAAVRNSVWIFFSDHAADAAFSGGAPAVSPMVSLIVYSLEGGLDDTAKRELIAQATAILGRNAGIGGRIPAHIVIRTVAESDWGMFGATGDLRAMRAPAS